MHIVFIIACALAGLSFGAAVFTGAWQLLLVTGLCVLLIRRLLK